MSDDLTIKPGLTIPAAELWFTTSRASGPGGQHVNKTSSRVTLHWSIGSSVVLSGYQRQRLLTRLASRLTQDGILQVSVEESRSQHRNKEISMERMAELVRDALKTEKRRVATKPTRGSKHRRMDSKRTRGRTKKMRQKPGRDD